MSRLDWTAPTDDLRRSTCGRYYIQFIATTGNYHAYGPDGEMGNWQKSNLARHACETDSQHRPNPPGAMPGNPLNQLKREDRA